MTLGDSIAEVRAGLGEPSPEHPTDPLVFRKLQDVTQLLHVEMQNTSIAWAVNNRRLDANYGQADYALATDDIEFGKDIRLITTDDADPYHLSREIRRCDLQDIDQFYKGPMLASGDRHTAVVYVMYRKESQIFVKLIPTPAAPATYELWYEVGVPAMDALGSAPILTQFQRYRNLLAQIQLLPHCRWKLDDDAYNGKMAVSIGTTLQALLPRYDKAWQNYITSDRQGGTCDRIGYGDVLESAAWY